MGEYPELFKRCLSVVLKNEGGFSDHPLDSGHATMHGVTQAVYDRYRGNKGLSFEPVISITDEEVEDVYYTLYWQTMNLEILNDEDLILQIFDFGVNAGVRTSIKLLQRMVDTIDDGYLGNVSLGAIAKYKGNVLDDFIKRRKLFYVTLVQNKPQLRVFIKGWLKRADQTKFE